MVGRQELEQDPVDPYDSATKKYVDSFYQLYDDAYDIAEGVDSYVFSSTGEQTVTSVTVNLPDDGVSRSVLFVGEAAAVIDPDSNSNTFSLNIADNESGSHPNSVDSRFEPANATDRGSVSTLYREKVTTSASSKTFYMRITLSGTATGDLEGYSLHMRAYLAP